MKLKEIYSKNKFFGNRFFTKKQPVISFEVFPPKDDVNGDKSILLLNELKELEKFNPKLLSITYGAGGSEKQNSLDLVKLVKKELEINIMPHFTCVNASKSSVENYLSEIQEIGIENILALRGDMPLNEEVIYKDFEHANNLVNFIKSKKNLSIAVAGYPEGHTEAKNINLDIENLKKKIDEGAEVIFTQLFFENQFFFDYVDLVKNKGIKAKIIPGILPITNYKQLDKMISLCNATIPKSLLERLEKHKHDSLTIKEIGIEFASFQVQQLIDYGVDGIHFYILNKAFPTKQILSNIL